MDSKAPIASISRRCLAAAKLGGGAIRRQTCGGEHDPEWTVRAQHEAHTAAMGLSCRKNYHNLGDARAALMENPGIR